MRLSILLCAVLFGCVGTGTADVQYSGGVSVSTPDLVEVEPGVQVVADYDESIFYTDGFYWRYDNGGWYRSSNYATGFVYYDSPPVTVTRIQRPERYVHYRPSGYVAHNRPERRPEPIVRDHRAPAAEVREQPRHEPEPVVRDHREAQPPPRQPEPVVRDHREATPPAREAPHAPPPPVRDHRDEKDKDKKH
jgi:hypothetical protein